VRGGRLIAEPVNLGEGWVGEGVSVRRRRSPCGSYGAPYIVLGGGDADELDELPSNCRRGGNELAFIGGVRLWEDEWSPHAAAGKRLSIER
jgi:hypothetical protein